MKLVEIYNKNTKKKAEIDVTDFSPVEIVELLKLLIEDGKTVKYHKDKKK